MDGRGGQNLSDLGVIGNGRIAALVNDHAQVLWWCFPKFDGDPVFSRLLAGTEEKGFSDVVLNGQCSSSAGYERNTAIIETVLADGAGNAVRVLDFAPRYMRFERLYHPAKLIRRIEPISGLPRIVLRVRPTFRYGDPRVARVAGSNHIRYAGDHDTVRLTTDAPVSYIVNETSFALTRPISLVFGPDEPLEAAVDTISRESLERTRDYWLTWVRGLAIPLEWQSEVIRAAITLQLCSFDETGAIVAAHTSSIPEAAHSGRNWDYRYCWLRDSHFVIRALNRLGATHTMESYLDYITTIVVDDTTPLKPVYGIVHDASLDETHTPNLQGFHGMGPVRLGNLAAEQSQHDAYGSVVLSVAQMFIDQRLPRMGDLALYNRLKPMGVQAKRHAMKVDAGIWEYRGRQSIHTHSATMCWVALDRLAKIAHLLGLTDDHTAWQQAASDLRSEILSGAWNDSRGVFAGALGGRELDACVLLLPDLGLIRAKDQRFISTLHVIGKELSRNGFVMRYTNDDFGAPETAFLACQFWYIDALTAAGESGKARELLLEVLATRNKFGLLSEDIDPVTRQLWGNMPQTYVMAGIVNSCILLSRGWDEAWPSQ